MRTYDEYRRILQLWEEGFNKSEIERITQIPRPTVRDCIKRFGSLEALEQATTKTVDLSTGKPLLLSQVRDETAGLYRKTYAYLFGLYLGDGSIAKLRRIYRLRITLDAKYPGIIESCVVAIQTLLPNNSVGLVNKHVSENRVTCVEVSSYYKHWPEIFPQHDVGRKHERRIELEAWQQRIVDEYPLEFWRGLYHSDGSRFSNVVNGKDYPRYQFTNMSADIIRLFCETCDKLGIHWTAKKRIPIPGVQSADIFISKRKDVEFLDREVGPKQ